LIRTLFFKDTVDKIFKVLTAFRQSYGTLSRRPNSDMCFCCNFEEVCIKESGLILVVLIIPIEHSCPKKMKQPDPVFFTQVGHRIEIPAVVCFDENWQ